VRPVDPTGLVVGTLGALVAMTPSLLPRSWFFQAMVSGISAAMGYGAGVAIAAVARRLPIQQGWPGRLRGRVPDRLRQRLRWGLFAAVPTSLVLTLVVASDWQREARARVGLPAETSAGWLRAAPVIIALAVVLVALWRLGRLLALGIARLVDRFVHFPRPLAHFVGLTAVLLLTLGLVDGVLVRWALDSADAAASLRDQSTPPGVTQPDEPERSGSPESLSPWDTLGSYGREFVAGGPSRGSIAAAAGIPEAEVLEPIRAYVGLRGRATPEGRAELAVAELERTGAFDRAVLCVVTTTGTGWVDSAVPRALEMLYGGDTAVVATQYSYLPSWLGFVVDPEPARQEGRALFDAVHARLEQLPEDSRPKLLVYGESQGSTGSEAAFDGLADIRERADGVLWVGPPNGNELFRQLVERRDPGTLEASPVYADGLVVRFGDGPEDLREPDEPWLEPRVVYLMHPTDPIVWWSPDLLFRQPDWLEEPRAEGVSPAMRWYPVITFWQITADLPNALSPPQGYGHNYGASLLDAWALIAPPEGWTAADTDRAREVFTG
jgi:uncharacterized membrane protein